MKTRTNASALFSPDAAIFHNLLLYTIFVLQARVERMEDFQKKGEDINKALNECRRKVAEAQKKVQQLNKSATDATKAELSKAQAEEKKLKKEERELEKKMDEHNRDEKKMPWNVDTLSRDGFSKVRFSKNPPEIRAVAINEWAWSR